MIRLLRLPLWLLTGLLAFSLGTAGAVWANSGGKGGTSNGTKKAGDSQAAPAPTPSGSGRGSDQSKASQSLALQPETGRDTNAVKRLLVRARSTSLEMQQGIQLANQALDLSTQLNYVPGLIRSHYLLGIWYWADGQYGESIREYEQGLTLAERQTDYNLMAEGYSSLASSHQRLGNYDNAMANYLQALRIKEQQGDSNATASILLSVGSLYAEQRNYDKALSYLQQAEETKRQMKDSLGVARAYGYLGQVYDALGQHTRAITYLQNELALLEKFGSPFMITGSMINLGTAYRNLGKLAISERALASALEMARKQQVPLSQARAMIELARTRLRIGNFESALDLTREANRIALRINAAPLRLQTLLTLSAISDTLGDHSQALSFYREYDRVSDSLFSADQSRQIAALQADYEVSKQQARIQLLEERQKVDALWRNLLLALIALVLFLAFALFWRYRQQEKTQAMLFERNRALEQANIEIQHHVETVEEQRAQIETAIREKDEFLGIAAHDLKNPIAAIRIFSGMLKDDPGRFTDAEISEFAAKIALTADQMMDIVSNLLDINRIEQGALDLRLEPIQPGLLIEQLAMQYRPRAATKQITLDAEASQALPAVVADGRRLMQVLDNLVSNAIKFSPRGGEVSVRAAARDGHIRFVIEDSGPGIPKQEEHMLFKKFARLSTRPTAGESSTGLGLSIVRTLTERMGGRVWFESIPGQGATFFVELPLAGNAVATASA